LVDEEASRDGRVRVPLAPFVCITMLPSKDESDRPWEQAARKVAENARGRRCAQVERADMALL